MAEKTSFGLLNGIAKRDYFGDGSISNEFLHEQLYRDLPFDEFLIILAKYETLLKNIVYSNMDLKQLDAFLTSQSRKKANYLTDDELANVTKFWKQNKQKIHDVVVQRSCFNDKMKSIQWRVDIGYRGNNPTDNPKIIFALATNSERKDKQVLHFEADLAKLDEMVTEIENVEKKIAGFIE